MANQACDWCGFFGEPLQVHGSYLCQRCRTNINPCCSGETVCEPELPFKPQNNKDEPDLLD